MSPTGDDARDGGAPERAWRTLARADAVPFKPGDRLLLEGGARFPGTLSIGPGDAGSTQFPVVVGSYGTGRATIEATGTAGISVYNTAGVEIRDLVVVGDDAAFAGADGIVFFSDWPDGRKLDHVVVARVDVSRFRHGIRIGSAGATGFRSVNVSDCALRANGESGLSTFGPAFDPAAPAYAHENVDVARVSAYGTTGNPDAHDRNTGSGIVLGSVRGGRIQRSVAHDNGAASSTKARQGPEGIWTYDSTGLVIEYNVSYANHTGSSVDGGGFGLDNNVSASTLQYNMSYGNDGPGYLMYNKTDNNAHNGNIVRFNISKDDSRKFPWYGGIVAAGLSVRDLEIYHNTVVLSANGTVRPPALRLMDGLLGVTVRNNLLVTDGADVVDAKPRDQGQPVFSPSEVLMQGNTYVSSGKWRLRWGERLFTRLDDWRAATGQEVLGAAPTGTDADPCLVGAAGPLTGTADAARMVPRCTAAVTKASVDLRRLGVDPGAVDYFGAPLVTRPTAGAAQLPPAG